MLSARRHAAAALLRVALAAASRGPVMARGAQDCLDQVAVLEPVAGFPARAAAVVWARVGRRKGRGLASRVKATAPTSIGPAHFPQGKAGKVRSLA
jgi:hypothetical protein